MNEETKSVRRESYLRTCDLYREIISRFCAENSCDMDEPSVSHYVVSKWNKVIHLYPILGKYTKEHSEAQGYIGDLWTFLHQNFGENAKRHNPHKKQKAKKPKQIKKTNNKGLTPDSPMPIGKHKGTLIKHLPKPYLRYIFEMEYTSKEVMELLRDNPDLLK